MWFFQEGHVIGPDLQREMMAQTVAEGRRRIGSSFKRVLLVPPDHTRYQSGGGVIACMLYRLLASHCRVDVMPALGQHRPHTPQQNRWMFSDVPQERILSHNCLAACKRVGEIESGLVEWMTEGRADWPIPISINRAMVDGGYDAIFSIGQVVPHEVTGFAGHNKNLLVGLGGMDTISASHIMAAACGGEETMGQIVTPLRGCFNIAEREYLRNVPVVHVLLVKTLIEPDGWVLSGLYVGDGMEPYVRAARYARANTVQMFDSPLRKVVCYMGEREYETAWVANKAIYRTRMALADGGDLLVIAPGVKAFGDRENVNRLIRKYGYKGRSAILHAYKTDEEMRGLGHAAAHIMHSSTEGRFTVIYAPGKLTREEVEAVGFKYMSLHRAMQIYNPETLRDGLNIIDDEEIYFIRSPGLGLWTSREKYLAGMKINLSFVERMAARQPGQQLWSRLKEWNTEDIQMFEKSRGISPTP